MRTLDLSKQTLGLGYLVGAGVVLSLALLGHAAWAIRSGPVALLLVVLGLGPALSLVAANYWLPRSGLTGCQIWTVAEWGALGIGVLTLLNVAVLLADVSMTTSRSGLLASTVAIGAVVGILVGALLELQRERRRLVRSNDLLGRILRHDIRNRLTVILGHLGELERSAQRSEGQVGRADSGDLVTHTERLRTAVEELVTTAQKAHRVHALMGAPNRSRQPVDLVPAVRDRLSALERANPDATVSTDLPPSATVRADGLLGTVLDNLLENAVVHSRSDPTVTVSVEVTRRTVLLRVADSCPTIPEAELRVFESGTETPLKHSKGVGLWLVIWVVEGYGGEVSFERVADDGNVVTVTLPRAGWPATGALERPSA